MKFTPGPWHPIPSPPGTPDTDILACPPGDDEGRIVASVCDTADTEGEANARLISAAPTMYEYIARKAKEGDQDAAAIVATIGNA